MCKWLLISDPSKTIFLLFIKIKLTLTHGRHGDPLAELALKTNTKVPIPKNRFN